MTAKIQFKLRRFVREEMRNKSIMFPWLRKRSQGASGNWGFGWVKPEYNKTETGAGTNDCFVQVLFRFRFQFLFCSCFRFGYRFRFRLL